MPILIALVVGLLAVVLTSMYVNQVREQSIPEQSLVMVAASDLAAGAILEAKDVMESPRFTQALPKLHIPWGERNLYLGQELRQPVTAGDYILISYFGADAGAARLSEKIDARQNQRAFTIPVTAESSLEGSIRSGDRIDLLLTYAAPKDPKVPAAEAIAQFVTAPLLDNVYVLATGRYSIREGDRYRTITLMVGSDEAKLLAWATKLGELSIALRNPKDLSPTDRAFLAGDLKSLAGLGKIPMRVEDVVGKERR
ncbi:MAG: Flp pilus assembly protein CpaB [Candidatus Binatia bacterium]